jgi:hypothetical protein
MKFSVVVRCLLSTSLLLSCGFIHAQSQYLDRLSIDVLDVEAPSSRVSGTPGDMAYVERDCRSIPVENLRNRIVNTAIQEWAYFGYSVYDLTHTRDDNPNYLRQRWRRPSIDPAEAMRVADSIAGYWSSTPDSAWILERQNQSWNSRGAGSRWRNPWSAAFISWVMCESGLGDPQKFRRAIAHHSYIDQAITAKEDNESSSAYVAYDTGEQKIEPGDMLCRGSRPNYESLAARREQLGVGARTHCDIVVKLDPDNKGIMLIGGNVRGWVNLKLLPADVNDAGVLEPVAYNGRRIFAHLKLQANSVPNNAFEQSPTLQSLTCEQQSSFARIVNSTDCS